MIKWRISPKQSKERAQVKLSSALSLKDDGTLTLKISGNSDYNGTFSGKWYALRHCVLVTLHKKSALLGNAFTLYTKNELGEESGENILKQGRSYMGSYDFYRVGYHTFDYFVTETYTEIFWGNEWTPETVNPTLQYEKAYTLYGEYFYDHFDGTPHKNPYDFTESDLRDIPVNGQVTLVFHEDGTATITTPDETETLRYSIDQYASNRIEFEEECIFYAGKNLPENYVSNWRSYTLRFTSLTIEPDGLYYSLSRIYHTSHIDENGERVEISGEIVYYRFRLVISK
jgi:hypothetical protein